MDFRFLNQNPEARKADRFSDVVEASLSSEIACAMGDKECDVWAMCRTSGLLNLSDLKHYMY